ncbi:restriction endonuclease subunit S [Saccharopolyspora sp. 6M]|uniref:restriction endonuclease subunit S n=1 Tax=Saccharopolyspora sp. 6M TaxID=2877237 RepID=UPI001CD342EB|nr:restriction endonuclease subunit S [Saccharopolyspora sp. 6M]MCA1226704.1 restriction endonuclease subunit S [Saccharopolyspora sp. 6M]
MTIPTIDLSEIAVVNPRLTRRLNESDLVAFLGMADLDAETSTTSTGDDRPYGEVKKGYTQFDDGDILVAKITPCFENGKIAQARLSRQNGAGSTEFHVIRPDGRRLDSRFLVHFLRWPMIRKIGELRMTGSAGQRRVPAEYIQGLKVPFLPLDKQQIIAKTLDRLESLRAKRRESIALLDELVQHIFLDMFADSDSPWPLVKVADLAQRSKGSIRTGPFGSQLLHEEFVDSGIAVLGIDNAVRNEFTWQGRRFITEEKFEKLSRYRVYPGDLLITIMGTCGRCAIVPDDIPISINTKHLCCITLDQEKCLPDFLHAYFLMHPESQRYLHRTAKGAIMSGLNMGIIKDLPVTLPPLSLQQAFVDRVRSLKRTKTGLETHLAELDALFASIQHRAFRGELWTKESFR